MNMKIDPHFTIQKQLG